MNANRKTSPIPVTVIGGFLGAGKTTLLNHILNENHGVRAAVLVNDFGAVNIDANLIVGVEGETVSLANGCVCCTIRDDLRGACLDLLQRTDPPEHLLVELSGLSDPGPVLSTFVETELAAVFSVSSILTVVDADQLPLVGGKMAELIQMQIESADVVVLNKVDLLSPDNLAAVRRQLVDRLPSSARILEVSYGRAPVELIFDSAIRQSCTNSRWHFPVSFDNSGGNGFSSWHWTSDRPLSLPKIRSVLEWLPTSVYRAKGIVYLEELPAYQIVLQMVGKRYSLGDTERWALGAPRSDIVLIGEWEDIETEALQRRFDACIGTGDEEQSPVLALARRLGLSNSEVSLYWFSENSSLPR